MSYISRLAQLLRDLEKVQLINKFGKFDKVMIFWGSYENCWTKEKGDCKFSCDIIFLYNNYNYTTVAKSAFTKELAPYIIDAFTEEFSECEIDVEIAPKNHPIQGVLIIVR